MLALHGFRKKQEDRKDNSSQKNESSDDESFRVNKKDDEKETKFPSGSVEGKNKKKKNSSFKKHPDSRSGSGSENEEKLQAESDSDEGKKQQVKRSSSFKRSSNKKYLDSDSGSENEEKPKPQLEAKRNDEKSKKNQKNRKARDDFDGPSKKPISFTSSDSVGEMEKNKKKKDEKKKKKKETKESDSENEEEVKPPTGKFPTPRSDPTEPSKKPPPTVRKLDPSLMVKSKAKMTIDVLFIMDITTSMEPWLNRARDGILEISREIKEKWKGYNVNFGFVGYTDIGCSDQLTVIDFSEDAIHFQKKLGEVDVGGDKNEDFAEDVNTGIEAASKMKWRSFIRLCFLICDAPAHGHEFHDYGSQNDNYHDDPSCTVAAMKVHLSALKAYQVKNFFFVRITKHTKKMEEQLDKCWSDQSNQFQFVVGDLGDDTSKLLQFVVDSVSASVAKASGIDGRKAD